MTPADVSVPEKGTIREPLTQYPRPENPTVNGGRIASGIDIPDIVRDPAFENKAVPISMITTLPLLSSALRFPMLM